MSRLGFQMTTKRGERQCGSSSSRHCLTTVRVALLVASHVTVSLGFHAHNRGFHLNRRCMLDLFHSIWLALTGEALWADFIKQRQLLIIMFSPSLPSWAGSGKRSSHFSLHWDQSSAWNSPWGPSWQTSPWSARLALYTWSTLWKGEFEWS